MTSWFVLRNVLRIRKMSCVCITSTAPLLSAGFKLRTFFYFNPRPLTSNLCLQAMLDSMLDAAEALCPHVMRSSDSSDLRQQLLKAAASRMKVPQSFISSSLLEQAGVDLLNKIRSSTPPPHPTHFLLLEPPVLRCDFCV